MLLSLEGKRLSWPCAEARTHHRYIGQFWDSTVSTVAVAGARPTFQHIANFCSKMGQLPTKTVREKSINLSGGP